MHDWHYFFHHVPQNLENGTYRIFEPQWKAEILHWFSREDVTQEQKEEFIKALVDFDDGCGSFYRYRAYFLASEALTQFKGCSLGDAIVGQLLKWSYAYFKQDKFDWKIYPQPLIETARAGLEATDRERVITAFVQMVHTTESRTVLQLAAKSLGQLDPGNKTAIAALVLLMQVIQDESKLYNVIRSLEKIDSGNQTAIAASVHLMETTLNKHICIQAVEALGEIGSGNQTAIAALIRFLQTNQGDNICFDAAISLRQIDPGNAAVIDTLAQIIETTQNGYLLRSATAYLCRLNIDNNIAAVREAIPKASAASSERLETTQSIKLRVAESLVKLDPNHAAAITALFQILETTGCEDTRLGVALTLVQINLGKKIAIATLFQLFETTQSERIRLVAAQNLLQTDNCDQKVIDTLFDLVQNLSQCDHVALGYARNIAWEAIQNLTIIDPSHQLAIKALVQLANTTQDVTILMFVAENLARLDSSNKMAKAKLNEVIDTLVQFIQTFQEDVDDEAFLVENRSLDKSCLLDIANSLKEILPSYYLPQVVTAHKDYLSEKFYKQSSYHYEAAFRTIWHCAQNMTYPDFCKAWY